MNIQAVSTHAAQPFRMGMVDAKNKSSSSVETTEAKSKPPEDLSTRPVLDTDGNVSTVIPLEEETTEKEDSGVLRLIEAGHFKGVAAVRLRINFAAELAEREAVTIAAAVDEQSTILLETVSTAVNEQLAAQATDADTETALQDALGAFDTAIAEAMGGGTSDAGALETSLQSAFGVLVGQLETLFAADDDSDPVIDGDGTTPDPTVTRDGSTTVADKNTFSIDDAIASLTSVFQDALASLLLATETQSTSYEFSPPRGNGVAFEKFVAIYEELRSETNAIDESA